MRVSVAEARKDLFKHRLAPHIDALAIEPRPAGAKCLVAAEGLHVTT